MEQNLGRLNVIKLFTFASGILVLRTINLFIILLITYIYKNLSQKFYTLNIYTYSYQGCGIYEWFRSEVITSTNIIDSEKRMLDKS